MSSRRPLRPTPFIEDFIFKTVSLDHHFNEVLQAGCGDLREQIRLDMEIERVAQELHVSWDFTEALLVTPLEGHLPDLQVPIFEPEVRLPGKPKLALFDLDDDLLPWEERLQRVTHDGKRAIHQSINQATEQFLN